MKEVQCSVLPRTNIQSKRREQKEYRKQLLCMVIKMVEGNIRSRGRRDGCMEREGIPVERKHPV